MRKNKWLMLGIAVILLLAGGMVFALEAALTVDIDVNLLSIDAGALGPKVGSINQTPGDPGSGNNYDNSAIDFTFKDDDGLFGGKITLDLNHVWGGPNLATPNFSSFEGWIFLGDYFKFSAGRIQSTPSARLTTIIDDQHLGAMTSGEFGVAHAYRTDAMINSGSTFRDLEVMGDFYFGKFFDQDFAVSAALFDTKAVQFNKDNYETSDDGMVVTGIGTRFSGTIADIVKLNLTYRWTRNDWGNHAVGQARTNLSAISANNQVYRNNFGLYAGLSLVENLDLTVGYGVSLLYLPFEDKASLTIIDPMTGNAMTAIFKSFDKSMDAFHGIDLRAQFALSDTFKIASHNNVSFGESVLRVTQDVTGAKKIEQGESYFGLYNALGAGIGLSDTLSLDVTVSNWLDIDTTVNVYDGKKNPWTNSGSIKEGVDKVVTQDNLVLAAKLKYALNRNAEFRCGIELGVLFHSVSESELTAPYNTGTRGTSISYEKQPTNPKGDSAVTYTYDNEISFKIPVGITVKF